LKTFHRNKTFEGLGKYLGLGRRPLENPTGHKKIEFDPTRYHDATAFLFSGSATRIKSVSKLLFFGSVLIAATLKRFLSKSFIAHV